MIFVAIAIMLLFLISCRRSNSFLEKNSTDAIKGIAIILIVFHHILNEQSYPESLSMFSTFGYLATGVFFMLSGYGNWISFCKQKKSGFSWIAKRIIRLYEVFIVCFIIMLAEAIILTNHTSFQYDFTIKSIAKDLITFSLPNTINWFPKVYIGCILVFFVICSLIKKNSIRISILIAINIIYCLVCNRLFLEGYWYNSVSCFTLGCIIALNRDKISAILNKIGYRLRIVATIVMVAIILIWSFIAGKFWNQMFLLQPVHALFTSAFIVVFSTVFVVKNKALEFCGQNSFEIYIFHTIFLILYKYININNLLYVVLVYSGCLILTVLFVFGKKRAMLLMKKN